MKTPKNPWKLLCTDFFRDVWNVPNVLTMLRLALIPVYLAVYHQGRRTAALIIFLAASLTDWLDGYLARRNHQVTNFGKLMDPLADKVMVVCVMLTQALRGAVPWAVLGIVLFKELLMILGGWLMLKKGVVVYAHMLGKAAQCAFIAGLVLSFFHEDFARMPLPWDQLALWLSVALTLCALIHYALNAGKLLGEKQGKP